MVSDVTFGGVTLPNAGKKGFIYPTLTQEKVLLSGKRSVQTSTEVGFGATYTGICSQAEFDAILAMVGSKATLIDADGNSYDTCAITGDVIMEETDNPLYVRYTVKFVQETL